MKKVFLSGLACAGLLLGTPESGFAHGGTYRGPGDVVPPNPGGGAGRGVTPGPGGPSTPGPGGPATPGPAGPATPGPTGPSTGGPAGAGPRAAVTGGVEVGPDLTRWQFWWEFNKDPFIRLKEAVFTAQPVTHSEDVFLGVSRRVDSKDTMRPSRTDIQNTILPALKRAIDSTDQRDINSSCMVAMAKIGEDHETFKILPILEQRLNSKDQEIRETAAISMGITQMKEAQDLLAEIAKDSPIGREKTGRSEVDDRTRSFACYGLGLVAYASSNTDLKSSVFETLKGMLEDKRISSRNIKVAVINGMRLLKPNPEGGPKDQKLQDDCIKTLWDYYSKDLGVSEQAIQAHVPPTIAKLLGRGGDKKGTYKEAFAKELSDKSGKRDNTILQSAALALGSLAEPIEVNKADGKYSDILVDYYQNGKDKQATYFSLIALAEIGGNKNRNELMKIFEQARTLSKTWGAIALGVLAFNAAEERSGAGGDIELNRMLLSSLREEKNNDLQAALAVGLGLAKAQEAADDLRGLLEKYKSDEGRAGYFCIGLALMNDMRSIDLIRDIVKTSVRRPELLQQAAVALGKLGDKTVTDSLQTVLAEPDQNLAKLSAIASALGFIGDRRTIEPLKNMLFNDKLTELSRAFAAVALGGIADKELLPWNSKVAVGMNYRAAVETLTDGGAGILDIL